jgi:hypothetical protein
MITVPTVTIGSDFDGAAADGRAYAEKFSGARTRIESWKASDTTCPQKPRTRSPTPYSESEEDWRELL